MAAAAFQFVQGTERLDWGVLVAIDVQRLVKDTNIDTLQRIVENLAFARVTRDEAAMFTPEHILHLFTLCQLVIQYIVCSQECLAKINVKLSDRVQEIQHRCDSAEAERERLHQENVVLRRELKAQRRTLLAYEYAKTAAGGGGGGGGGGGCGGASYICPHCGDAYAKNESLQSHMRKRHMKPAAVVQPQQPSVVAPPSSAPREPLVAKADYEVQAMQVRQLQGAVDRLEQLLEKEKDRNDRLQHDSMMMMMQATLLGQRTAVEEQQPQKSIQEKQQEEEKQQQQQQPRGEEPLARLPLVHAPTAALPLHASPDLLAAVPVMPDIEALQRYNTSRQQESNNNALLRQLSELEKAVRELKNTKKETLDGRTASTHSVTAVPSRTAPPPTPAAAPPPIPPPNTASWLAVSVEQPTVKENVVTPTPVPTVVSPASSNAIPVLGTRVSSASYPQHQMQVPHAPTSSLVATVPAVPPPPQQQQPQAPSSLTSLTENGTGLVSTSSTLRGTSDILRPNISNATATASSTYSPITPAPRADAAAVMGTVSAASAPAATTLSVTNDVLLEKYGPTGPAVVPWNLAKNPHLSSLPANPTLPTPSSVPEWIRSDFTPNDCSKDASINTANVPPYGSSNLRTTTGVAAAAVVNPSALAAASRAAPPPAGSRPPLASINIPVPASRLQTSPPLNHLGNGTVVSLSPREESPQATPTPIATGGVAGFNDPPAALGAPAYSSGPLLSATVFAQAKDPLIDPARTHNRVTGTISGSGSTTSGRSSSFESSTSS